MKREKRTKPSRHGRHDPDKVLLGCFATPEQKALALIVANASRCDLTRLLLDGIKYHATACGIMENGKVRPEYELEVEAVAARIREGKRTRQKRDAAK